MTRRMLINARSPEEVRLAIVTDSTLDDYQLEVADRSLLRGNIYRGTIASIQPSLNAAFIDYGGERHGFLSSKDLVPEAFYRDPEDPRRPRIEEVLERAKPIVVQVARESEGDKGAVLTTDLSLAGRYLVFTPFGGTRGVSRKVEDEDDRQRLKEMARGLDVAEGSGVIVRTNALGQNKATLQRDLSSLLRLWKRVSQEAREGKGTRLLYSDQELIFRALRDYLDASIQEIVVDDDDAHARADEALESFMPRSRPTLVRYQERAPLFSKYGLEEQIATIYERRVPLPSGGSLVIDRTEALTAIDVNSGRATGASSQEETAVQTDLEAAAEVARQLRLRDIGGLVVVDFIDMRSVKNQRKVEKALRDAMKADKARSTVGRISPNGLLEVNRQRLRQSLSVRTHKACPTCAGTGRIPSPEMVGLNLLRQVEARAAAGPLSRVRVELHPEYADSLQNSRRQEIARLESDLGVRIEVIAAPALHRAEHKVEWFEAAVAGEPGRERGREEEPSVRAWKAGGGSRGEKRAAETKREPAKRRGRGGGGRGKRGKGQGEKVRIEPDGESARERRTEAAPVGAEAERSSGAGEGSAEGSAQGKGSDSSQAPAGRRRRRGRGRGGGRSKGSGSGGGGEE